MVSILLKEKPECAPGCAPSRLRVRAMHRDPWSRVTFCMHACAEDEPVFLPWRGGCNAEPGASSIARTHQKGGSRPSSLRFVLQHWIMSPNGRIGEPLAVDNNFCVRSNAYLDVRGRRSHFVFERTHAATPCINDPFQRPISAKPSSNAERL